MAIAFVTTTICTQMSVAAILPDCEAIAAKVETATGLPQGILASISRVESGHAWDDGLVKGWPWATNNRGKGKYFDKREEALTYIKEVIASGDRNIDVGCMQINYRWHGKAFKSIDQMIDPAYNVPYAAKFLSILYDRHGNWDKAIRYYHSGNSKYNRSYLARVKKVWPDVKTHLASLASPQYGRTNTPDDARRTAALGFEDLPMPEVVVQGWKQGISLWAESVPETMTSALIPSTDGTATLATLESGPQSPAQVTLGSDKVLSRDTVTAGASTGHVTDKRTKNTTGTLEFYGTQVTRVASIDELPPTLSRHYAKIERFREMLKKPAGL
ncbi:MAG: lytic transglycosylase domain-containing protein [Paracoccaceae bacterium]|nr:lytic transglycosylase domain-containing protein [Paracoccaceae bacterium]